MTTLVEELRLATERLAANPLPIQTDTKLKEIPRFYIRQEEEHPTSRLLKRLASEVRLDRVEKLLLSSSDLEMIWDCLV